MNRQGINLKFTNAHGFTLIELLIAMALGLLVTASALGLLFSTMQTRNLQSDQSRIQIMGSTAVEAITVALAEAGVVNYDTASNLNAYRDVSPKVADNLYESVITDSPRRIIGCDGGFSDGFRSNDFTNTACGSGGSAVQISYQVPINQAGAVRTSFCTGSRGGDWPFETCRIQLVQPGNSREPCTPAEDLSKECDLAMMSNSDGNNPVVFAHGVRDFSLRYQLAPLGDNNLGINANRAQSFVRAEEVGNDWTRVTGVEVCMVLGLDGGDRTAKQVSSCVGQGDEATPRVLTIPAPQGPRGVIYRNFRNAVLLRNAQPLS